MFVTAKPYDYRQHDRIPSRHPNKMSPSLAIPLSRQSYRSSQTVTSPCEARSVSSRTWAESLLASTSRWASVASRACRQSFRSAPPQHTEAAKVLIAFRQTSFCLLELLEEEKQTHLLVERNLFWIDLSLRLNTCFQAFQFIFVETVSLFMLACLVRNFLQRRINLL